ncbi:hypothetical protein [Microbacterium sp. NPDC056234]|uniref:hypothetical protein n=1 Tax=Microbacterium sp. NPDC056234 TaxID=3345757 RepID=UPI0035D770C6
MGQPQAASASTYLNETAAVMRASATGQPTELTIATQHLGMVGGPNEKFRPFGDFQTGATGAVVTETSSTYISESDGTYVWTSQTDLHAAEIYGDESAVRETWSAYYGSGYPIGEEPATRTETWPGQGDDPLPVPTTDFPTDPAAFLAEWESGMEAQMIAEKAEVANMPMDGEPETNGLYRSIEQHFAIPAAEFMLDLLSHSVPLHVAAPEYRATFLEALALADGITVEDDVTSNKVLVYEAPDERFRLTINPEAGAIVQIERFLLRALPEPWNRHTEDDPLVDVGSAPFVPEGTPSSKTIFTSSPVG